MVAGLVDPDREQIAVEMRMIEKSGISDDKKYELFMDILGMFDALKMRPKYLQYERNVNLKYNLGEDSVFWREAGRPYHRADEYWKDFNLAIAIIYAEQSPFVIDCMRVRFGEDIASLTHAV